MKLTFIGCGSAFNKVQGQNNMILEADNGKKMLIDCGSYCCQALNEMGIKESDYADYFDAIYISHAHGDHAGGIEEIAFCTYFNPAAGKIKLYCVNELMGKLWCNTLQGALASLEGKVMHLKDYFDCKPVICNEGFIWEGLRIQTIQMVHFMNGFEITPSYGLLVSGKKKIFITTDTQFCPNQIKKFYDMSDIIFHDCETAPYYSGVHAHYDDLKTLEAEIKNRIYLCHYNPNPEQNPQNDGFMGFVSKGEEFKW